MQTEDLEPLSIKFDRWMAEVVYKFQSMVEVVKKDIIVAITNKFQTTSIHVNDYDINDSNVVHLVTRSLKVLKTEM